jgi:hypothetical protein
MRAVSGRATAARIHASATLKSATFQCHQNPTTSSRDSLTSTRNRYHTEETPSEITSQHHFESGRKPIENHLRQGLPHPSASSSMLLTDNPELGYDAVFSEAVAQGDGSLLLHGIEAPVVSDEDLHESQTAHVKHSRGQSLHVNWTLEDVEHMVREIFDETIADVHLSLFGYWIREQPGNYETAKSYIRELSLDQVSLQSHRICCVLELLIQICRAITWKGLAMSTCASFLRMCTTCDRSTSSKSGKDYRSRPETQHYH